MSKGTLGYWDIRGLGQHNRLLLTYLGVEFEDKRYEFGPAPEYDSRFWLEDKFSLGLNFPNMPYWIDGSTKVTESRAIYKYIARTHGPELIPSTPVLQALADEAEGVASDTHKIVVDVSYGYGNATWDDSNKEGLATKLDYFNKFLAGRQFVTGDKVSYADFFVYEGLFQTKKFGEYLKNDILSPYSNIQSYLARFEALPQLKEYIKASEKNYVYSPHAPLYF